MVTFKSKSSTYVKAVTISTSILLISLATLSILQNSKFGLIGGSLIAAFMLGAMIYLYLNALKQIVVNDTHLILEKNKGHIKIPLVDIKSIFKLENSNLPMTLGSKGFFGFTGTSMDGAIVLVQDRKNMIKIETDSGKNYMVSVANPEFLVKQIKKSIVKSA